MSRAAKTMATVSLAVAVALGGSVYAFAGWTSDTPPAVLRLRTLDMPAGSAPSVTRSGRNAVLDWAPTVLAAGVRAQRYEVVRVGAGAPVTVCAAVATTTCRDKVVPGGTWSWKVRPGYEKWVGELSAASLPLTFAAPPEVAAVAGMGPAAVLADVPVPAASGTVAGSPTPAGSPAVTSPPTVPGPPQADERTTAPQVEEEPPPAAPSVSAAPEVKPELKPAPKPELKPAPAPLPPGAESAAGGSGGGEATPEPGPSGS